MALTCLCRHQKSKSENENSGTITFYIHTVYDLLLFFGGGGVVVRRLVTVSYENKKYIFLNDKINIQCPDICRLFINLPKTNLGARLKCSCLNPPWGYHTPPRAIHTSCYLRTVFPSGRAFHFRSSSGRRYARNAGCSTPAGRWLLLPTFWLAQRRVRRTNLVRGLRVLVYRQHPTVSIAFQQG